MYRNICEIGIQDLTYNECLANKDKLGIKACCSESYCSNNDYWAGAVKACHDIGLHLASPQTLANITGAKYGRTDIGPYTIITRNDYSEGAYPSTGNCATWWASYDPTHIKNSDKLICVDELPNGVDSPVSSVGGAFWSSSEVSSTLALRRNITSTYSSWNSFPRYDINRASFCVAD